MCGRSGRARKIYQVFGDDHGLDGQAKRAEVRGSQRDGIDNVAGYVTGFDGPPTSTPILIQRL
ncbi:hypothetical protein ABIB51_004087 [Arthrobacter sp. UYCu712]